MKTAGEWMRDKDPRWGDCFEAPELTPEVIMEIQVDALTGAADTAMRQNICIMSGAVTKDRIVEAILQSRDTLAESLNPKKSPRQEAGQA